MAKLESTFKNMAISLVAIAVVAGAALAGVYSMTKDKIDEQKAEKESSAVLAVLPNAGADAYTVAPDTVIIVDEKEKKHDYVIYRAYSTQDSSFVGAAVKVSEIGFGGKFKLMVGFDKDTLLVNYSVLEHQETPGLGDKMGKWFNDTTKTKSCVIGRNVSCLQVSKEGGEIDAITAATISSKAFLRALKGAYEAFTGEKVDCETSASEQHPEPVVATSQEETESNPEEVKEEVEQQQEKEEGHE